MHIWPFLAKTGIQIKRHWTVLDRNKSADSLKLIISPSLDCSHFYNIMVSSLSKTHGVSPVHTLAELEYLMASHPNNIKYYAATLEGEVVGGTFLFIDEKRSFVHTQYTHANEKGREARAIDALVMNTIAVAQQIGLTKLSFGISISPMRRNMVRR